MANPTVCAISGVIRDTSGTVLSGAVISVQSIKPFIHPTDNSLIVNYSVSTTSAADGTFTLSVVETTTPAVTLMLTIKNSSGTSSPNVIMQYNILVPNSASTTLATLISGQ